MGDAKARQVLLDAIGGDLTAESVGWHRLSLVVPNIRKGYLARWATAVRANPQPGAELVARHVAAHLLDLGYSPSHLYRWLDYKTNHQTPQPALANVLDAGDLELGGENPRMFRVLVPVKGAPHLPNPAPASWKTAPEVSHLVHTWGGNISGLRQNGGFLLEVSAMDRFAAAAAARDVIDRWNSRVELATSDSLSTILQAWIEGVPSPLDLSARRRGVRVRALKLEFQLYATPRPDPWEVRIDDAFQLAQPAETGPRSAAIAGAWASIASLLTSEHEDDRLGAPRLAAIVACSFPRAELTRLARVHEAYGNDQLAQDLSSKSNLDRSELIAAALMSGQATAIRDAGDEAAARRMRELLTYPQAILKRIRGHLEGSINRLHRQRNLLLHAGLVSGDGRTRTLRSAPTIVGAGLDRIAHAWFAERTTPLELAARAENGISLVGSSSERPPTRLLEP